MQRPCAFPLRLFTPALAALAVLLCALAPARAGSTALRATSQSCLRGCLASCAQAPARADCLNPCLDACPAYCGAVDTDCALGVLESAPPAALSDGDAARLAARCAEACVVKPNCPPPKAGVQLQELAAEQHAAAQPAAARQAVPAPAKPRAGEQRFTARDGSFSLLAPKGWKISESGDADGLAAEFALPGAQPLDYTVLRVRHVTAPQKTAERALNDLRHPRWPAQAAQMEHALGTARLAGREVVQRTLRGVRSLLGLTPEVPNLERVLLLGPEDGGSDFFVLTVDVPQALEERHGPALARMLETFRPTPGKPPARPAEVTAEEYAVYAAFLQSNATAEVGDIAPYLYETARTRTVYDRTVAAPELKAERGAFAACGGLPDSLATDYAAKRTQRVLVTDRLPVPQLGLRREGEANPSIFAPQRMGMQERIGLRPGQHLPSPALEFSRVAFDAEGQTALFYVTNFGTSPGTSHLLLMVKRDGVWRLRCASMLDMRIY